MYDLEEIPVKPPKTGFGDIGNDWEIKNALAGPAQGWGMGLPRDTQDRREQETHTGVLDIPKCVQCSSYPALLKWWLLKSLNFPFFSSRPIQINLL